MESRILESSFGFSVSCGSINRYRFSSVATPCKPFSISFPQTTRTMRLKASKNDEGFTYKGSGVDIDAGAELTRRIMKMVPGIGGFSGGFSLGGSSTLGDALMVPTIIYVKQVLDIINKGGVKGLAHITGGGLTDNIPRILPDGLGVVIHTNAWELPPLFSFIQKHGNVEDSETRRTFNMGIGMVLVVSQEAALRVLGEAENGNYVAYRIGEVINGEGVTYD